MFKALFQRMLAPKDLRPEEDYSVSVNDDLICISCPDGKSIEIAWEGLNKIEVHTNDTGPWGVDAWFVLEGRDSHGSFPLGTKGLDAALDRFKLLPGFKLQGMNSTSNAIFKCWVRDDAL